MFGPQIAVAGESSSGSGFIIQSGNTEATVVANAHVVDQAQRQEAEVAIVACTSGATRLSTHIGID